MLKKVKFKILSWLLQDEEIEDFVVGKVIGDAEVKQYYIEDSDNVKIENCIIYNSQIRGNRIANMSNNIVKKTVFDNNIVK